MSKTQSISKAKDGYVKVTFGKEEYWVDDYKNATNWSALASRIFSINEK